MNYYILKFKYLYTYHYKCIFKVSPFTSICISVIFWLLNISISCPIKKKKIFLRMQSVTKSYKQLHRTICDSYLAYLVVINCKFNILNNFAMIKDQRLLATLKVFSRFRSDILSSPVDFHFTISSIDTTYRDAGFTSALLEQETWLAEFKCARL